MEVIDTNIGTCKRLFIISLTLLFLSHFNIGRTVAPTGTSPTITFVEPTDPDDAYVNRTYTNVNVSATDAESPNDLTAFIDWNDSLVGWWRFNENTGTTLTDFSGNGNDGSLNNFDWTSESDWTIGRWDSGLKFDGNNDHARIPNSQSVSLSGSTSTTLMAWIYPENITTEQQIIDKRYDGSYSFGVSPTGKLSFCIANSTDYACRYTSNNVIDLNKWQLATATWEGSTGTYKIYVDDIEVLSTTGVTGSIGDVYYDMCIGCYATNFGSSFFDGIIDEVRIHSRALSQEEIFATYNAGLYRLYHNFTNLSDATYKYTAYVQDIDGNVNQTETRTVTIDTQPPIIDLVSPLNATYLIGEVDLIVNFDSNVLEMWYSLDGEVNITACYNCSDYQTTFNLGVGLHNIILNAVNSLEKLSSITRYFTVTSTTLCMPGVTHGEWRISSGDSVICSNIEAVRYGNIIVESGANLTLQNVTLKMVSVVEPKKSYYFNIQGNIIINNSNIMSWDPTTNQYPYLDLSDPYAHHTGHNFNVDVPRAYIHADSPESLTITNSNLSYLGNASWIYSGLHISKVNNMIIKNNYMFNNFYGLMLKDSHSNKIINNTIQDGRYGLYLNPGNNNRIEGNTISTHSYHGFYSNTGSRNNIISNNTITKSKWMDIALTYSYYNIIENNLLMDTDRAIYIAEGSENNIIRNNTIINSTWYSDGWHVGVMVRGAFNTTIINNNFTQIGSWGIYLQNATKVIIKDNYIDIYPLSEKVNTETDDMNDPPTGIYMSPMQKLWTPIGEADNYDEIHAWISRDVTISNNTFGPNVQVLLRTTGTENLTHDLSPSDFWHVKFQLPNWIDPDEYYINNDFTNLINCLRWYKRPVPLLNNILWIQAATHTQALTDVKYIISKDRLSFTNGKGSEPLRLYNPNKLLFTGSATTSTSYTDYIYIDLPNDSLWYHTVNMTVIPSSDSVDVTVVNSNNTYKKWILSSVNPSITVDHVIGDFPPNTEILIKRNGIDWNSYVSNSTGYISFTYDEGFSAITLEAEEGSYIPPPDVLSVVGTDLAPINVTQGEVDVEMLQLTLTAINSSLEVTDIQVDLSGTGSDTDVAAVKLYHDVDDSGTLTLGDIQLGTTQIFLGGILTFTGLSFMVSVGTPENIVIVYDISITAIAGDTIGCVIADNTYITVMLPDTVNPFTTINSTNSTIPVDNTLPTADAGVDQQVTQGATVIFNGSSSSDNSGNILNYTWSFNYDGSLTTLYNVYPSFKFVEIGNYKVTLTVWDPTNNSATDTMWVNVTGNDSDSDGLTDYDEENIYGTDPYNPDTDGDSVSDSNEVDNGTNPLVAEPKEKDFLKEFWWLILLVIITVIAFLIIILLVKRKKKPNVTVEDNS